MIEALLKNSPTSDMEEIKEAVGKLIDGRHDAVNAVRPFIQVNQAAYSDLRCYFDEVALEALVDDGYMKVGEVMSRDELEELFDEIEIPEKDEVFDAGRKMVLCQVCGEWKRWTKYNDPDQEHYIPCCECDDD